MGTHPIFESDFDCLTDMLLKASELKQAREWFKEVNKNNDGIISMAEAKVVFRKFGCTEKYIEDAIDRVP